MLALFKTLLVLTCLSFGVDSSPVVQVDIINANPDGPMVTKDYKYDSQVFDMDAHLVMAI